MRPRLLDLFCGAGGAAVGYARSGFDVVGVDINPQPHYPYTFHQGDAMGWPFDGFDAIHASPPCQHYAPVTRWRGRADNHPDLIAPIRHRLETSGVPWVIENVRTNQLRHPVVLCGSQFGLSVRRHRWFESNALAWQMVAPCHHRRTDLAFMHKGERAYADAMGCHWMSAFEAREAIPPAYTEYLGAQLVDHLAVVA